MPTLHWVGKDKVVRHHHDVPFKVLKREYRFEPANASANASDGNKIIHGDNLEALKALLPEYEGRIQCVYIDPPYNTGNEGWVYNDNVNDPRILKWLHKVVGKEGEDLSRHDKWLCMMYPRLKLLHRLLAEDGVIFVSIDDNEVQHLRPLMDEIFGSSNRIEQFIWKKSYGGGAKERYAVTVHEYILLYANKKELIEELSLPPDSGAEARYYKLSDEKLSTRGPFRIKPLEATKSMDRRENLVYPIIAPDGSEVYPKRQWWWARERAEEAQRNNELYFQKVKDGNWSISYKQYLRDNDGNERKAKPFSIIDGIYTQKGSSTLREIFEGETTFQFPKPPELIERILSMLNFQDNAVILDSFAGSGTTAHAVLKLNAQDGGNRKFILVEMMDYAETITAERVRRVMEGYGENPSPLAPLPEGEGEKAFSTERGSKAVEGLGGGFEYFTLGEALFSEDGQLNEAVGVEAILRYVAYSERIPVGAGHARDEPPAPTEPCLGNDASRAWPAPTDRRDENGHYHLGETHGVQVYFIYQPDRVMSLDLDLLAQLPVKPVKLLIYADQCLLGEAFMRRHGIVFKKIPRDITRF